MCLYASRAAGTRSVNMSNAEKRRKTRRWILVYMISCKETLENHLPQAIQNLRLRLDKLQRKGLVNSKRATHARFRTITIITYRVEKFPDTTHRPWFFQVNSGRLAESFAMARSIEIRIVTTSSCTDADRDLQRPCLVMRRRPPK